MAHRGASGYLPEHTLAAYELGLRLGADAFEIDVVPTADGHLVARHENDLTGSTDVAAHPELADRRTIKVIEGVRHMGWFTEDFTLAEIGTLRAREPLPALRSTEHDGQYAVPALPEILTLRAQLAQEMGRPVGLKLEVKSPVHFAGIGHAVEDLLLRDLAAAAAQNDPALNHAHQTLAVAACADLAPLLPPHAQEAMLLALAKSLANSQGGGDLGRMAERAIAASPG